MSGGEFLPGEPIRKTLTLQDINTILMSYPLRPVIQNVLSQIDEAKNAGIHFSKIFDIKNMDKIQNTIQLMTIIAILELLNVAGANRNSPIDCSLKWDKDEQNVWVECNVTGYEISGVQNMSYEAVYNAPGGLEYNVLTTIAQAPPKPVSSLPQILYETVVYPPHKPSLTTGRIIGYNKLRLSKLSKDPEIEKQVTEVIMVAKAMKISANPNSLKLLTEIAADNLKNLLTKYTGTEILMNMMCRPSSEGIEVTCGAVVVNSPHDIYETRVVLPVNIEGTKGLFAMEIVDEPDDNLKIRKLTVTVKEVNEKEFNEKPFKEKKPANE